MPLGVKLDPTTEHVCLSTVRLIQILDICNTQGAIFFLQVYSTCIATTIRGGVISVCDTNFANMV